MYTKISFYCTTNFHLQVKWVICSLTSSNHSINVNYCIMLYFCCRCCCYCPCFLHIHLKHIDLKYCTFLSKDLLLSLVGSPGLSTGLHLMTRCSVEVPDLGSTLNSLWPSDAIRRQRSGQHWLR